MTSLLDRIAGEVVYRHVCHCENASEVPAEGEPDVHEFTVDGTEFPWYITERGAIITQFRDDLFLIDVEIMLVDTDTKEYLSFGYAAPAASTPYIPVIDGQEFPWLCNDDPMVLTFGHKVHPTLALKFFAHNVIGS